MATAKRVGEVPDTRNVELTLTHFEASVLVAILGRVAGHGLDLDAAYKIYDALKNGAGVPHTYGFKVDQVIKLVAI